MKGSGILKNGFTNIIYPTENTVLLKCAREKRPLQGLRRMKNRRFLFGFLFIEDYDNATTGVFLLALITKYCLFFCRFLVPH